MPRALVGDKKSLKYFPSLATGSYVPSDGEDHYTVSDWMIFQRTWLQFLSKDMFETMRHKLVPGK